MYYIVIGIIIFIALIVIIINRCINKINIYIIKINEAQNNIDLLLEKKILLLTKIKDRLKEKMDDKILEDLPKIKNKELNSFALDIEFKKLEKEFKEVLDYNKNFIIDDETNIFLKNLERTNIDLKATKHYYNDNGTIYNNLISRFPVNIVALFKKHYSIDFYDDKEEEEFEILKEK